MDDDNPATLYFRATTVIWAVFGAIGLAFLLLFNVLPESLQGLATVIGVLIGVAICAAIYVLASRRFDA